jgi:hypothetical protein
MECRIDSHMELIRRLSKLLTRRVPDPETRRAHKRSTFLLLSLGRYLCCWTISPRVSKAHYQVLFFGSDIVYYIYVDVSNLQSLNNVIS